MDSVDSMDFTDICGFGGGIWEWIWVDLVDLGADYKVHLMDLAGLGRI